MWLKKLKKSKSYIFKKEEKRFTARLENEKVLTKSYSVFDLPNQMQENDYSFTSFGSQGRALKMFLKKSHLQFCMYNLILDFFYAITGFHLL